MENLTCIPGNGGSLEFRGSGCYVLLRFSYLCTGDFGRFTHAMFLSKSVRIWPILCHFRGYPALVWLEYRGHFPQFLGFSPILYERCYMTWPISPIWAISGQFLAYFGQFEWFLAIYPIQLPHLIHLIWSIFATLFTISVQSFTLQI